MTKLDALNFVSDLSLRNARLREASPVYPEIYQERSGNEITLSTWVPFEYDGKSYDRHCVEVGIISDTYTEPQLRHRLSGIAFEVMAMAVPILSNQYGFSDRQHTTNPLTNK